MYLQENYFSQSIPQSERALFDKTVVFLKNQPDVENILVQPFIGEYGHSFRPDLYLPNGCRRLGFEGRTAIELKASLGADTLLKFLQLFKELKEFGSLDSFILVYEDRNEFPRSLLWRFHEYRDIGFFVYSVSRFCQLKPQDSFPIIPDRKAELSQGWEGDERLKLLQDAHNAFIRGRNSLFLGAGLGKSIQMPDWDELLKDLLGSVHAQNPGSIISESDYPGIDNACRHSSIIMGRYIENGFTSSEKFNDQIRESLYRNHPMPDSDLFKELVHMIRSRSKDHGYYVDQAITFNFDDLLETAIDTHPIADYEQGRRCCSVFDRSPYNGNSFPVYHVHGMVPQEKPIKKTPVLGEQEYHKLYKEAYHWSNVVQLFALSRSTCFFVGLSMTDPNLRRLLDISRNGSSEDDKTESNPSYHYAIMEQVPLDTSNLFSARNEEHFRNQERMMEDLGIRIIWYNYREHNQISEYLRYIRSGRL